eukprot:7257414-Pyramimonas_sp.AAC.1
MQPSLFPPEHVHAGPSARGLLETGAPVASRLGVVSSPPKLFEYPSEHRRPPRLSEQARAHFLTEL